MNPHRITYTTPKGELKNNILIEAESREQGRGRERVYEGLAEDGAHAT